MFMDFANFSFVIQETRTHIFGKLVEIHTTFDGRGHLLIPLQFTHTILLTAGFKACPFGLVERRIEILVGWGRQLIVLSEGEGRSQQERGGGKQVSGEACETSK